jgi:hypothetical protein
VDRRSFLKSIATIGLALAAPAMPIMKEICTPRRPRRMRVLSRIMEAQYTFWRGREMPTLILMSPTTFDETLECLHPIQRFYRQELTDAGVRNFHLNGADVISDPKMPDDKIRFVNERYPTNPALSGEMAFA